jgi:hypothetical protein
VNSKHKKAELFAAMSMGRQLSFCSGTFKVKVEIQSLQEHETTSEPANKYPDEVPFF